MTTQILKRSLLASLSSGLSSVAFVLSASVPASAQTQVAAPGAADTAPPVECGEAMDVGAATKIGARREGDNIRFIVETPSCPNLRIVGIWKALELTQGSRALTGKVRGLSGPYAPGEKAIIGRNLAESNPFLEPGDLNALKGVLNLKGTVAMEYEWQRPEPPKSKARSKKRGGTNKKKSVPVESAEPAPSKVRINLPVSLEVQAKTDP